jgi:hypothetical protein
VSAEPASPPNGGDGGMDRSVGESRSVGRGGGGADRPSSVGGASVGGGASSVGYAGGGGGAAPSAMDSDGTQRGSVAPSSPGRSVVSVTQTTHTGIGSRHTSNVTASSSGIGPYGGGR